MTHHKQELSAHDSIDQLPGWAALPEIHGLKPVLASPKYPGFYQVFDVNDLRVLHMDEQCCEAYGASLDEIKALGADFVRTVTHPNDLERIHTTLSSLLHDDHPSMPLTYLHRTCLLGAQQQGYFLVITSVRLSPCKQEFHCITNTTTQLPVFSKKVCNALNARNTTKWHVQAYLSLTPREKEVFAYLATGLTVKEIAAKMIRSTRTVEQHKKNIYKKLQVNSLSQITSVSKLLGL